jgi:hypothetical protein
LSIPLVKHQYFVIYAMQLEIKSQKDELQRQRDALQRQMDLFEEQRRGQYTLTYGGRSRPVSADRHGSPPCVATDRSASIFGRSESPLMRAQSGTCLLPHYQMTGGGTELRCGDAATGVGVGGGLTAPTPYPASSTFDNRQLARTGSAGSLVGGSRRDVKVLPTNLLSATNQSKRGAGGGGSGGLAGSGTTPDQGGVVQQLIPFKLSSSIRSIPAPSATSRRDAVSERQEQIGGAGKKMTMLAADAAAQSAQQQQQQQQQQNPSTTGGRAKGVASNAPPCNILPMKLAEGRVLTAGGGSRASTSSGSESSPTSITAQTTIEASTVGGGTQCVTGATIPPSDGQATGTNLMNAIPPSAVKKATRVTDIIYL